MENDGLTQEERIEDVAMIDSRVKKKLKEIYEESNRYQEIDDLVEEAFKEGLKVMISSGQKPGKVDEEHLKEDDFKYSAWQLNLYPTKENQKEWVNIKSTVLRKGLKKISK